MASNNTNNTNSTQSTTAKGSGLSNSVLPGLPKKHSLYDRFNDWFKSHNKGSFTFSKFTFKFHSFMNGLGRTLRYFLLLGLISFLVVHFCPETADQYPVLFQFFEGTVEFYEFMFKVAMSFVNVIIELITLNFSEAGNDFISLVSNFFAGISDLFSKFVEWLNVISF